MELLGDSVFIDQLKSEHETLNKRIEYLKKLNIVARIVGIALVVAFVLTVLGVFLLGVGKMEGDAMAPSISNGDVILFYKHKSVYNVGDIVTFKKGDKQYVLRVIAIEGQIIETNKNDEIVINNHVEKDKKYLEKEVKEKVGISLPYKVEEGKVFVISDQREIIDDSRIYGAVKVEDIDGKIISIFRAKDV